MTGIVRKGLKHCGGRVWSCVECGGFVTADCECCEPPACPKGCYSRPQDFVNPCKKCLTTGARLGIAGLCPKCGTEVVQETIRKSRRTLEERAREEAIQ